MNNATKTTNSGFSLDLIGRAEGALSPWRAYQYLEIPRRVWGCHKDPEKGCKFLGKADDVKRLIWC